MATSFNSIIKKLTDRLDKCHFLQSYECNLELNYVTTREACRNVAIRGSSDNADISVYNTSCLYNHMYTTLHCNFPKLPPPPIFVMNGVGYYLSYTPLVYCKSELLCVLAEFSMWQLT